MQSAIAIQRRNKFAAGAAQVGFDLKSTFAALLTLHVVITTAATRSRERYRDASFEQKASFGSLSQVDAQIERNTHDIVNSLAK